MPDEYPSNSRNPVNQVPPRQRQEAVVTNVMVRKKPWLTRAADRSSSIGRDILLDVIRPYFTDMFADSGYRVVDLLFYNNDGAPRRPNAPRASHRGRGNTPQVTSSGYVVTDYNSQYQGGSVPAMYEPGHTAFDFSVYVFPDFASGREVIDRLYHIVTGYHQATVNDLYDLLGKSGTRDSTGENWGWGSLDDINNIQIRRVRGNTGYYLDIPEARPLHKK